MKNTFAYFIVFVSMSLLTISCGQTHYEKQASYTAEEEAGNYAVAVDELATPTMKDEPMEGIPVENNTEEYSKITENNFKDVKQNPLSTFSIDVDNASYSNIRRYVDNSQLPPAGAVRIEEMINYFDYEYPNPTGEHPFSVMTEIGECPWNNQRQLIHIGIQGKKLDYQNLKPSNLVFLIDASGSMDYDNKLPLLKKSLALLLDQLSEKDRVAIVAYAGSAGLVLESTPATEKNTILKALNKLEAGGSTAGGEGIQLAYKVATDNLISDGNNRVILATDGDFNVGASSTDQLIDMVREHASKNIYLTILGFGMGNYKDYRMEEISNSGNGNYFYIDEIKEAEKVFVREMRANMFTIAKDVKIQIEFNPNKVKAYRLIGYENRVMQNEDFENDKKDAGELGAGHTVTALYEIIPASSKEEIPKAGELKYQSTQTTTASTSNEVMTVKLRYKPLKEETSKLIEMPVSDNPLKLAETSNNFRFSAAVAQWGLILRNSEFKGTASYENVIELAKKSIGKDEFGDRAQFIRLVESAKLLSINTEIPEE
jgi:Ca-activated chloride channel family protein